jgi:hypothetical protein
MDELLRKRNKNDTESEHSDDENGDGTDSGSELGDVKPVVLENRKAKSEGKLSVDERFDAITSQVSTLAKAVSKLVLLKTPTTTEVVEEAAQGKAAGPRRLKSTSSTVKTSSDVVDPTSEEGPSLKSLSRNKELSQLLKLYNQGDTDFLSAFDVEKLQLGAQGEKPRKHLAIPDFITRVEGTPKEDEGVFLSTAGGKLTFKAAGPKKIEVQNVCFGQWIGANSRIHEILYPSLSPSQNAAYNEYTRMVGDLYQLYTEPSVILLDDEHRRLVALSGRSWADISLHLERLHLKIKPSGSVVSTSANQGAGASVPSKSSVRKSNNPCYGYNSRAGCKNPETCRYKHVCSDRIEGVTCRGAHPKFDHAKFQLPTQ